MRSISNAGAESLHSVKKEKKVNHYLPTDEHILILGRTKLQQPLPLFWTGSGLEFTADGSTLSIELSTDYAEFEQWIRMELDGATVLRMPLPKGKSSITLYRGLNPQEKRRVRILKEVQAFSQDDEACLLIHGIELDGLLYEKPAYPRKIEVIGDSLTSGEGLQGAKHLMDWGSLVHSTEGHYVEALGEMLDAEVRHISQGGWGAYISWDGKTDCAIPPIYEKVCGLLSGAKNAALGANEPYDFSEWKADAVVINLGTNDGSGLGIPCTPEKAQIFAETVKKFLHTLRRCNPDAYLLWAYGMCGTPMEAHILSGLEAYKKESGDTRVSYLSLTPCPDEWLGSRSHPGRKSHALTALEVGSFLQKVL